MSPTNAFVTGAHGLTLVHSIYYKGFLLNSIRCLLKSNLNVLAMENIPEITPHKKKKKIDFNLCMICQSHNSSLEITKNVLEISLVTLIDRCKKRRYYKDSKVTEFIEKLCIICQMENKNILCCDQTLQMGDKMLSAAQKLLNKGFYRHLNTISAANNSPVNDVMYHNTCWVNAKRQADKTNEIFSEKDHINTLSDVEIVHFVEKDMADPSEKVLDMKIILYYSFLK